MRKIITDARNGTSVPMLDIAGIRDDITSKLRSLEQEVSLVYVELMRPRWGGDLHGFPQTLHGYMMVCFSWVDLLSSYWKGSNSSRGQTLRMVDFMDKYISPNREANNVATQLWRHKLMHTSEPRRIYETGTGVTYDWLLHWWKELPQEQHWTLISFESNRRILNVGLMYLIADLEAAARSYLDELANDLALQTRYKQVNADLDDQRVRFV